MQQVSYGPLIMSIMLIMSCYTGFFNVRRGWQSLNTGPRFYLRLIRRTGWLWIYTSRTTDGRPFKPKKLSVPFLYPVVPAGLTPFRELVPLGRRNLVPILPPAHSLGGGIRASNDRFIKLQILGKISLSGLRISFNFSIESSWLKWGYFVFIKSIRKV